MTQQSLHGPQSALLLTQPEWDDLEQVCLNYIGESHWATLNPSRAEVEPEKTIRRRRALCERVIEANR